MANVEEEFDRILDTCLDLVLRDGETVEVCLRRFPQHADELGSLLQIALDARRVLEFTPSAVSKTRARLALRDAIDRYEARRWWRRPGRSLGALSGLFAGSYRWAASATVAVLLVVMGGAGIVGASSNTVPGHPLYSVKRVVEQGRMLLTFDDNARARLYAERADKRFKELQEVAEGGDERGVSQLANEAHRSLQEVQKAVPALRSLPTPRQGVGIPVPSTVRPIQLDRRTRGHLRELITQLQTDEMYHREALRALMEKAPSRMRPEIRRVGQETRQSYAELILAIKTLVGAQDK
ncbi:MAG: hypothetical protein IIB33_06725 [Chloroflexi bacterium]|nr:hypothetical protein [Chloroflexota bacterium]